MTRTTPNLPTRFRGWPALGVPLFSAAATEALVAELARGSAPVAVALLHGGPQHSVAAAGVGCGVRAARHSRLPVPYRVGGR